LRAREEIGYRRLFFICIGWLQFIIGHAGHGFTLVIAIAEGRYAARKSAFLGTIGSGPLPGNEGVARILSRRPVTHGREKGWDSPEFDEDHRGLGDLVVSGCKERANRGTHTTAAPAGTGRQEALLPAILCHPWLAAKGSILGAA
jgi:hypothetical protein